MLPAGANTVLSHAGLAVQEGAHHRGNRLKLNSRFIPQTLFKGI